MSATNTATAKVQSSSVRRRALAILAVIFVLGSFAGSLAGVLYYSDKIRAEGELHGQVVYETARIRILASRIVGHLTDLELARRDNRIAAPELAELAGASDRATELFNAFSESGCVRAITGHVSWLRPVPTEKGLAAARDLQAAWLPLQRRIQALLKAGEPLDAARLADAQLHARQSRPKLDTLSEALADEEDGYYHSRTSALAWRRSVLIAYPCALVLLLTPGALLLNRVREANTVLEQTVAARTDELRAINESLQQRIAERERVEEELRRQSRMNDAMFQQAITCFVLVDRNLNFLRVNEAFAKHYRLTAEDFRGRNFFDLMPAQARTAGADLQVFEEVVVQKRIIQSTARPYVFADQPERGVTYWDSIMQPILDERGEVEFVFFSSIDATERTRAEEALRALNATLEQRVRDRTRELAESERIYRLLFNTMLQGVVYQTADGVITLMNPAAERILGKSSQEMIGKTSVDFEHQTVREDGSPFPALEYPSLVALRTGSEVRDVLMGFLNPREDAVRWINITAIPLFTEEGGAKQSFVVFDDVTERRLAEQKLLRQTEIVTAINRIFHETLTHESEAEVAATFVNVARILSGSSVGCYRELAKGRGQLTQVWNDRAVDAGDLVVAETAELFQRPALQRASERAMQTGLSQLENEPQQEPGDPRPAFLRWLLVPVIDAYEIVGIVCLANKASAYLEDDREAVEALVPAFVEALHRQRSQTAVRQLNEQLAARAQALENANRELESFSYSVSHDLRAPLRSIDGFSRILIEDYSDKLDEEGVDTLKTVRAASQRMGHLIDDMLMLSKVTRAELRRTTVDLSALAQEVAGELRRTTPERAVECLIEPGLIAETDSRLIRIVLENLLGNAWKFTGRQSAARVEFGRNAIGEETAYFVRDNGVGFDPEYMHRLFGAFQRLHTIAEFPGTGIGLATVQRIVHRHHGRVWAESTLDQGATFYFTLPHQPPIIP